MTIEPTQKQEQLLAAALSGKYKFILFGGAIRGAKTFGMLLTALIAKRKWAGMRLVFTRKDIPTIERNTYPTWEKFNPPSVLEDRRRDNKNPRIIFKNSSELIFFGENYARDKELNRWRGLETNWFMADEINEFQELSFYKMIERTGSYVMKAGHNPHPLIIGTCNPTQGWVKQLVYDPWKKGELRPDWLYIPAKITDNPYLPPEYIESLKQLPKYEYEVFVNGNWDINLKTGGEFLKSFELSKHLGVFSADIDNTIHISIDSNVMPYIAVTIWQLERQGQGWFVKQVHELPAKDPENTARRAGAKSAKWLRAIGYNQKIFLYGDPTTKARNNIDDNKRTFLDLFMEPLEKEGYLIETRFFNKAPSVAATGDFINAIFDDIIPGIEIKIGESCIASISDYIDTKEDKDGGILKKRITDPVTGISYEPNGHLTDTLRYFIVKLFSKEFSMFSRRFSNYADKTIPTEETSLLDGF